MRGIARYVATLLLGAGFFICLAQALLYEKSDREENICILQTEVLTDGAGALSLTKNDPEAESHFTLWGETKNTPVTVPDLNRQASASLITAAGSSDLVMPGSRTLTHTDAGRCLIDEKLSMELYGSTEICGEKLIIDSKEYEITGLLFADGPAVLIQADKDTKAVINRVSLKIHPKETVQETIRRFSNTTGIQGIRIPLHLYGILTKILLRILIFLMLFLLLFRLLMKLKAHGRGRSVILLLVIGGLSAVVCIWILDINIRLPMDLLPSKWSDFKFWSDLAKEKGKESSLLWTTEKSVIELHSLAYFFKSLFYSLGAVLTGFPFLNRLRIRNLRVLAAMTVCFLLLSFSFAVFYVPDGSALVQERVFWLFFPLCFWLKYLDATVHSILKS